MVNADVTKVVISEQEDLLRLAELQLHERFPKLASIKLKDGNTYESERVVRSIVDFVATTLSNLPHLSSVDLISCRELDTAGAAQSLASCTNLQEVLIGRQHRSMEAFTIAATLVRQIMCRCL
jgi:hypothetical protein